MSGGGGRVFDLGMTVDNGTKILPPKVHQSILECSKAITDAISRLIQCATLAQVEIVASGRGSGSRMAFYKKNSRWMDGLISAAKAVASATNMMVLGADGVVHGTHKMEQLIVGAHEVGMCWKDGGVSCFCIAGTTAQLVLASRVNAERGSKTQEKLEVAAKAVSDATKLLMKAAEYARQRETDATTPADFSKLSAHEFKKSEMEQQVQILTLEKNLSDARKKLGDMRKFAYHNENDYVADQ